MAAEKIFLVGMMGSGKSHWTKKIAKWIKSGGYDLDDLIEMNEEKTIAEIFTEEGEEQFRKIEAKILRWFKEKKKYILATGGGTPCFHDNMAWMKKEGIVIWLDESEDILVKRLVEEKAHRPLIADLSEQDLTKFIKDKLVERHAFYSQANYRLSSDQITDTALKQIIQQHA
ncbi:MAG: AAA family ATPase [Sediminibacterium sp.]|jgi:shikimate kinase|nr:AAA family ATPase [Sediminibacterium sp.]